MSDRPTQRQPPGKPDALERQAWELAHKESLLEAVFDSRIEGTFTTDAERTITAFNQSAERITGYARDEAIGHKCWEIFNSDYCEMVCRPRQGQQREPHGGAADQVELSITRKDGSRVPVRANSVPLKDASGATIGTVDTFLDISELVDLTARVKRAGRSPNIIGRSQAMKRVMNMVDNVSRTNSTVLVTGESGTGKELVARAIHLRSQRRGGPFVAFNCSAFAETLLESELFGHERGAFTGATQARQGRFELARGGTLFMDEIGDISLPVQVKLLRVLETLQFERVGGNSPVKVDARLISATNRVLLDQVQAGRFREDLFYRVNVINIHIPPLRERMEDLPLLVQHVLAKCCTRLDKAVRSVSPPALDVLLSYPWPGNVRELENALEHAFVMCPGEIIGLEHLPEALLASTGAGAAGVGGLIQQSERQAIEAALEAHHGHRGHTAAALGIDKSTLWRKMKKLGLL